MKKIRLDVAELRVDSFSVTPEMAGRKGTVLGQSAYTVDFPWSMCLSDPYTETRYPNAGCPTGEYQTCNHTVCDCDQDANTQDDC